MKKTQWLLLLLICNVWLAFAPQSKGKPGDTVADFRLPNVDGRMVTMKDYSEAKGFIIVFTCNHCPFAKRYEDRLNAMDKKYAPLGYPVIAISSSDVGLIKQDGFQEMVKKAKDKHFTFPYLLDSSQLVAQMFGAAKTPHAFVVQRVGSHNIIKYSGAIDNNGAEPERATQHYVTDAVDALLAGQPIAITCTKSIGCEIKMRAK
jgi:peroxiredoxin